MTVDGLIPLILDAACIVFGFLFKSISYSYCVKLSLKSRYGKFDISENSSFFFSY